MHTPAIQRIFLVRHGESLANLDLAVYKSTADHAVPLSPRGHEQAHAAGRALREHLVPMLSAQDRVRIWTSPYRRTRETADALQAELSPAIPDIDRREHINLCEQQFGLFDGVPTDELPTRFPHEHAHYALAEAHEGKFWARMPLGESRFDVAVRVQQAFGSFHRDAARHGINNLIVVCHGVTLRAFAMQWLRHPYEWMDQQSNPGNCDIYCIDADSDEGQYVYRSLR